MVEGCNVMPACMRARHHRPTLRQGCSSSASLPSTTTPSPFAWRRERLSRSWSSAARPQRPPGPSAPSTRTWPM
eukprot:4675566-Pyramimonas_sp.AAC.1